MDISELLRWHHARVITIISTEIKGFELRGNRGRKKQKESRGERKNTSVPTLAT